MLRPRVSSPLVTTIFALYSQFLIGMAAERYHRSRFVGRTTMATDTLSDERKTYIAVQKIIDAMLEFDPETRARMLRTVATFFTIDIPYLSEERNSPSSSREGATPPFSNRDELSPKEFLIQKKPKTDVERVACLAFYLMHYRNVPHFKTTEINKLNTEAAQLKFSNASNAVNNATQSGFLVPAPKGAKQLSAAGEQFVDHLPDHVSARKKMSELKPRRRKKSNTKSTAQSIEDTEKPDNE